MIRVRLYNVGFGDCILITVDQPSGPWRMLVDCGVHPAGVSTHDIAEIVGTVITDVTTGGSTGSGPHLDLVVATHRHRDHVSGFADPRWATVTVGEVWLPWTESPSDVTATALRSAQETAARGITAALAATSPPPEVMAAAANSQTNEAAMATLQSGFAGSPTRRYLPTTDMALPAIAHPAGLTTGLVHILGPSHDPTVLRHMDPPSSESYRSFSPATVTTNGTVAATRPAPFPAGLALTEAQYQNRYHNLWQLLSDSTRGHIVDTSNTGPDDALAAIAGLDNAINNTSLILTLEVGGHILLLPGDAQWGPWQAILGNADTTALLDQTTFYKVSHHGSHNGTPKSLVTRLANHVTAGISVHRVPQWPKIPEPTLVSHLEQQMTVFQTDQPVPAGANFTRAPNGAWTELTLSI